MEQKCALEKQILQNALSLSSIAPDKMAFQIMKTPGYTAVTTGEVIHLIKCMPVDCRIRQNTECHNELSVTYQNQSYFLTSRSRILVKTNTQRDCNELLPIMFKIHDSWFWSMPRLVETIPPAKIQPLIRPIWKYVNPASLATSGIYSIGDLHRFRNHIMFPVEKLSMLNTIAKGAMEQHIPEGSISMMNRRTIARQNSRKRRDTPLGRLHNIWISQRKSHIHNYAAYKINCRYNRTRVHFAALRHSFYSRNMEFRHPSLPRQTD